MGQTVSVDNVKLTIITLFILKHFGVIARFQFQLILSLISDRLSLINEIVSKGSVPKAPSKGISLHINKATKERNLLEEEIPQVSHPT